MKINKYIKTYGNLKNIHGIIEGSIINILNKLLEEIINIAESDDEELAFIERYSKLFDYSSICLLLGEVRDYLSDDIDWNDIIHKYMIKIKNFLDSNGYNLPCSNFRGNCDIGFGVLSLCENTNNYKRFLYSLNDLILEQSLRKLKESQNNYPNIKTIDFDIISGLAGTCSYLLNFKDEPMIAICIKKIISYLVLITQEIEVKGRYIPGWYISSENQYADFQKELYPEGNFNFGFSHGISGVLSILSICIEEGVEVEGQREGIKRVLKVLREISYEDLNGNIYWPGIVCFEDYINKKYTHDNERASWCYGSPGIARAIFLGGKAINDYESMIFGEKVLLDLCSNEFINLNLNSAIICHGYAGLLAIIYSMYLDTGNNIFCKAINKYALKIIDYFDPNSMYGFYSTYLLAGNLEKEYKIDFLNGASGICLALLLVTNKNNPILLRHLVIR